MHQRLLVVFRVFGIALLAVAFSALMRGQGITTASINGAVKRADGSAVSGAVVTIVHDESQTRTTTQTRENGQFNASGLRPGGPYTVTAAAPGYPNAVQKDVYLSLDRDEAVNFTVGGDEDQSVAPLELEKYVVTEENDKVFGVGKIGTGSSFTSQEVVNTPTVRRNVQDIAQLDSRLVVMSLDQGGNLSAQGQNFRFNSFLIDGVQANDPFGLNGNGFSSLRSPVPIEAIQALNVDLNPFDVRRSGFTGALINAVIKSGTNQFHGGATYERTEASWRATNPLNGQRDAFNERTYNFAFGGPIIRNKLFFFLDYDDFKRTAAPPAANFVPQSSVISDIVAKAKALGYDPGTLLATNSSDQKTVIAKLDWNISSAHRLTVTYWRNHGEDTNFASFNSTTTTSLSNYWFAQPRNTDSYTAHLFSTWAPNFRTEATLSYSKYDGSPKNHGSPFPQVTVNGIPGVRLDTGAQVNGSVVFGTENSRQLNAITTKELNGNLSAEYSFGNHTLNFGGEADQQKYSDQFVQNFFGNYTFATPSAWEAGTPPLAYQLSVPYPGRTLTDAFGIWTYTALGLFLQDTWKPSAPWTIVGGIRLDDPYVPDKPQTAAGFQQAFGISNTTTNNGNYTVSPRVGFVYEFPAKAKTQLRGGVGLFQGRNPAVWLTNAYQNTGAISNVTATTAQLPSITFVPDVTAQPVPKGTPPTPNINVTDPNFIQPAVWKGNLAFDRELPWDGIIATVEVDAIETYKAIQYQFLNYKLASTGSQTAPDGRIRYDGVITPTGTFVSGGVLTTFPASSVSGRRRISTFADVIELDNTDKGSDTDLTLELARPMRNHWAWSASWTHMRATEVSPITSSTALSNYQNRAVFNPNEDTASLSNTNIKDRIVATLTREFQFFPHAKTTVSLVYQGRTGHPYSWVFHGDANGDGLTFNDLFYVPTGPDDPRVRFVSTAERDAFFAFVNSTDLKNYAGGHAPRNSETSPWTDTIDLRISQEIPIYHSVKTELYLDLINIGNMIKKSWGLLDEVPFAYRRSVAGATYDKDANNGQGQWVYTYNANTVDPVPITVNDTPVSRWQIQAGLRVKF